MRDAPNAPQIDARRVAVLGDLHLARPGTDACGRVDAAALRAALDDLRAAADVIVVNGDLFDLERGPLPWRQRAELARIAPLHAETLAALDAPDVVHVWGNHDRVRAGRGAVEAVCVRTPGGAIRIEHGDRFNAPIKRVRWFASGVTWLSGRVQAPPWRPIYDAMKRAEALLAREGEGDGDEGAVERNARRWLGSTPDAPDALVIGHTHRQYAAQTADRWLLNPGASTEQVRAVVIDGSGAALDWSWWEPGGDA